MNWDLRPYFAVWICLAVAVLVLFFWRKSVASHEDDSLHVLESDAEAPAQQAALASKLERLDKWGKILTVIAVVFGLVIAGVYAYQVFVQMSQGT
jgi:hypothetical protein